MKDTYEVRQFLSLYKTYENLLREHGKDYRSVEEAQTGQRMTLMRQMRNYLSHAEDPGFIAISPVCLSYLENLVKEEQLNGALVKDHLITPAKGSLKEGTPLTEVVYKMSKYAIGGILELPVYDPDIKRFKGILTQERAAYELFKKGDISLSEEFCGPFGNCYHLVKPGDPVPEEMDNRYYICTRDGSLTSQYMGYIDK